MHANRPDSLSQSSSMMFPRCCCFPTMAPPTIPFSVVPLAQAANALAALPKPIVHLKGWASRLLLAGAPDPPHKLDMRSQPLLPRNRADTEACAEKLVAAMVATAPGSIVWDGDALAPDAFTALIMRLLARLPGVNLAAFAFEDWVDGFQASWLQPLSEVPPEAAPAALTLITVPLPAASTLSEPNSKYVHLGRTALVTTGATHVFCLGGGAVTSAEVSAASGDAPPRHFAFVPAKRWACVDEANVPAAGGALKMEASPLAEQPGVVPLE